MTILYRYVTREILSCFFIVLVAVMGIYVAIDFVDKIDNFMEAGVPASRCVVYLLYKLPFIFVQIAPVGFLLSILVALGLMSKNNEIIALKSCGIGISPLLKPAVVLGIVFCGVLFVLAQTIVPVFMVKADQIWLHEVRKKNIYASRTNDIWIRAARQIIHIKQYEPKEKRVVGITIYSFDKHFRLIGRIDAESGVYAAGRWQLNDVVLQVFDKDGNVRQHSLQTTRTADIDLAPADLAKAAKETEEMGLAELKRYIEKAEREGYPATRYRVDYQSEIAAPFVCIFLSVLGVGIALRGKLREGLPLSITYGLSIAFIYWIFNSFCISLGYAEMLPPVAAAWSANLVFSCAAGLLLLSES